MYTSISSNLMAANTARNLNQHYANLATSTRRLSSGLRINSAADDAAGLAIRELMRVDIAAFHQGARNANDAISMLQVADGALAIIDEKLIRMKELAEQAATGTYNSTQRLMIESEYQSMASEITRIANATDFNGIKLLDGSLVGKHDGSGLQSKGAMKIHFGAGNDSSEDYYYVEIGNCTSAALGLGNSAVVVERNVETVKNIIYSEDQRTFKPNGFYIEYTDPATGNKYYSDGDNFFSDTSDPAGSALDWKIDSDLIERLRTEQETLESRLYYYVYNDSTTGKEYYSINKRDFTSDPFDPYGMRLDPTNIVDKNIIDHLVEASEKHVSIRMQWDVYEDNDKNNYYSYNGGKTYVPDPEKPMTDMLQINNPDDKIIIDSFKPSLKVKEVAVPADMITYDVYVDPNTSINYYSSDNGNTFVSNSDDPTGSLLDPTDAADKAIIDNLVHVIDDTYIFYHYDAFTSADGKTTYYRHDNGKDYFKNINDPTNIILSTDNPGDIATINSLIPKIDTKLGFSRCEVYEVLGDSKRYYSLDHGNTFFVDLADPRGSCLDANNPADQNIIANLKKIDGTTAIVEITYDIYVDNIDPANPIEYYTFNGNTFITDVKRFDDIKLDINNPSDKVVIDRLIPKPGYGVNLVKYDIYFDPNDNNKRYYTISNGQREQFIADRNHPNVIDLDINNPGQKDIIDRLQPLPDTKTVKIPKPLPPIYDVYVNPDDNKFYYSWDGGFSFTSNPGNPYDQTAWANQAVIDRLQPDMTTVRTVELVEQVTEHILPPTAGYTISTQESAQKALEAIDNAIVSKDKIRAHIGALQNRLENTVSNLNIQAENLQAAESRISDVDVATEMTSFVRNQILAQSSVAMLGHANSMPQMLMQLISR